MAEPLVHVYDSLERLSEGAAACTARLIRATPPGGRFSLVLSGGTTPRLFHRRLATTYCDAIPWDRVHLFWGDERYVPPEDADSNLRMARETLIRHIPLPEENVHPVPTHLPAPEEAAAAMEETLRTFFGDAPPGFDLVVLGMGSDGHTASLFPGDATLEERQRWVCPVEAPAYAAPRRRITMTLPLLNQSRHVLFLVSGAEKHRPLQAILGDPEAAADRFPAARVDARVSLEWFVDEAAYGLA